jgi:threonine dehydrogenase-like Zn-dependent dehydrogenase
MLAAVFHGPGDVSAEEVPQPRPSAGHDVLIRVTDAAVCGSDLWTYRGQGRARPGDRIGHEFAGEVIAIGSEVRWLRVGDWVIAPFRYSDGTCPHCAAGLPSSCPSGGLWGREVLDAGQGQFVRAPFADATLVKALPTGEAPPAVLAPHLLTLADVLPTGYHAAHQARVGPGSVVAVVGDGAVGLCAVLAAGLLGAERVIAFGAHPDRLALAKRFGAETTSLLRGDDAVSLVREATAGLGADQVIEAVGTAASFDSAVAMARPGGTVSYVGLPHGVQLDLARLFPTNVTITGGIAPARRYLPELLPLVLDGRVLPGEVFTATVPLTQIEEAYRLMDQREAVKVLIDPTA